MESPRTSRGQGWLRLTSFAPVEGHPDKLTVSLEADLLGGHRPPRDLRLLARRDGKITAHRPIGSDLERIAGSRFTRRHLVFHWRVCFELPAVVGQDPRISFQLVAEPHPALDLPTLDTQPSDSGPADDRPTARVNGCVTLAAALLSGLAPTSSFRLGPEPLPALELPPLGWKSRDPRPVYERPAPRLGALLASTAALLAGLGPGFALADAGSSSGTSSSTTSTAPVITQASTGTTTAQTTTTTTSTTTSTQATVTTTSQPPATTSQAPPPTTTTTPSTTPTSTRPGKGKPAGGGKTAPKHPTHHRSRPASHHHHAGSAHRTRHNHAAKHHPSHRTGGAAPAPRHASHSAPGGTTGTPSPVASSGTSFSVPVITDLLTAAQLRTYNILVGGMVEPPTFLQRIYRAAGKHYHIPWQILAAINYVETRYGKDLAVSPAGAIGWMQFMPATWAEYGQSVNLKGKPAPGLPDPWDPTDAIFAAARYLRAAGAGPNMPGAVYAYNHAGWYVQEVLSIAEEINRHNMWPQRHAGRKIAAMLTMARLLNGLPYVWGGGHSNFAMVQSGYDCSGFVSAVLHAGGYLDGPVTTQSLPGQPLILPGRGRYVTIRDRTYLSADQDHVIIDIDGQWWESGGWGTLSDRVHRMHNVTRAYLDSFNLILHPRGL